MPNNHNGKFFQGNPGQGRPGMNLSQTVSANYSNLSTNNNMNLSQVNTANGFPLPNRLNSGYNQQIQMQMFQQNSPYNNFQQQSYGQPSYNPSHFQQGNGQNYQNNYNKNNNGNFPNRMPQPNYQLPENW